MNVEVGGCQIRAMQNLSLACVSSESTDHIFHMLKPHNIEISDWLPATDLGICQELVKVMSHEWPDGWLLLLHHGYVTTHRAMESSSYTTCNLPDLRGLFLLLTYLMSSSDSVLASDVVILRMGTCCCHLIITFSLTFSLTFSDKSALV